MTSLSVDVCNMFLVNIPSTVNIKYNLEFDLMPRSTHIIGLLLYIQPKVTQVHVGL